MVKRVTHDDKITYRRAIVEALRMSDEESTREEVLARIPNPVRDNVAEHWKTTIASLLHDGAIRVSGTKKSPRYRALADAGETLRDQLLSSVKAHA